MIVMFLAAGIFAGVIGMIVATILGLGLALILAAYPVFGMAGVCLTAMFTLVRRDIPAAESSLG